MALKLHDYELPFECIIFLFFEMAAVFLGVRFHPEDRERQVLGGSGLSEGGGMTISTGALGPSD